MERFLYVHEIFPSFQGEGLLVGVPQVFIRLSGCNLRCSYCDTPEAWERVQACSVYGWRGEWEAVGNPLRAGMAAGIISSLWERGMHSVSLTGGEPLLQAEALTHLLQALEGKGMPIYLETNGTLGEELELVLPWIDWIAMDIKLPSSQGGEDISGRHGDFLARASGTKVILKVVITAGTGAEELERTCSILGGLGGGMPLVLQPVTPRRGEEGVAADRMAELYRIASGFFDDVRVIPQSHRAWGVR
ncbi:MAG: 7-carboxy-7-deazaguanine synthase QueE [Actinobacteria bacterium]|nr:7-carboxy-7-deazaguanine synthase QueE [Actinomycetota bacterium]